MKNKHVVILVFFSLLTGLYIGHALGCYGQLKRDYTISAIQNKSIHESLLDKDYAASKRGVELFLTSNFNIGNDFTIFETFHPIGMIDSLFSFSLHDEKEGLESYISAIETNN